MSLAKFIFKGSGVEEILNSSATRALLEGPAEQAASNMRANAPVVSGDLARSITIEDDNTDRVVKRVVANVPYAMVVEADTGFASRSI
jgi:hypothetical protein